MLTAVYLLKRFVYRILSFFRHWYADGFLAITRGALNSLELFDRFFALKVSVKNWFQPMYGDYSFISRVMGASFRTGRIFSALIFYLVFCLLALALFLAWAAIPLWAIYQIATNNLWPTKI